jgi:general secretion pathway protein B
MSFILDALKKSESDRQRQNGPALFEVKVAPPRTRLPPWALAIAALLVVNLGIVMWMVLRHPARAAAGEASAPAATATAPGTAAGAASVPAATVAAAAAAPAAAATPVAAPAGAAGAPAVGPPTVPAAPLSTAARETAAGARSAPAVEAPAGGSASDESNPDDYAPAQEPAAGGLANHVRRGTAAGVPLYQDASATPGTQIPQLRLDLHVFAVRPQDRFVMINMHKVREGDTLPEGVHVDSITPDGAIVSYNGSRFLLPRE